MNQKNISIICIALCLILIGGYILRQNYLLEKAYKTAGIYDYIPAEESKIILEIEQVSQIDSITSRLPILRRASPILSLWQEILSSARLPETSAITISFSETGEAAIWYCMPRQKQKNLKKILPRLISNNYRPVCETKGSITVNHYALHNGSFLHVLFAPGVTAISFESSLFREADENNSHAHAKLSIPKLQQDFCSKYQKIRTATQVDGKGKISTCSKRKPTRK